MSLTRHRLGVVEPGRPIAVEEEYLPGEGIYVDKESGLLRAAMAGVAYLDSESRKVWIEPAGSTRHPRVNSEVLAMVTQVRHDLVMTDIYGELRLRPAIEWLHEYSGTFSGAIPIGNIADEYIKDINDYYRVGDVVVAKVVSRSPPYTLTTKSPQYGVVGGVCRACGGLLRPLSQDRMKCSRCGSVEKRKVSVVAGSRSLRIGIRNLLVRYRYL